MAIPPTVLRTLDRNFKFSELKEKWLAEVEMGNAVKVAMGFKQRVWRNAGYSGYTFNDNSDTVFWDSSMMVETTAGSLTFDSGGDIGYELAAKSYAEIKDKWLTSANEIYPGLTDEYNGRISKFVWHTNPYSKGSYTCYKPGQWSSFAGIEAEPHENIFFAGEHCSVEFQGFMNGAAETGKMAAAEISKKLSVNNV
jgi:monoamine oxidase